jgi:hypothetical protein
MLAGEHRKRLPRAAGGLLGVCLAVTTIVLALPSGGRGGVLPASLDIAVRAPGALAVTPAAPRPLLHAPAMRPGGPAAAAELEIANQTGQPLRLGFRAAPSSSALDGVVRVRIASGGRTIADEMLAQLRSGGESTLSLARGARRTLRVSVRIPAEVATGYEGRHVRLELVPVLSEGAVR